MLVLTRQRDESVMIGDNVQVTVADIRGEKVRLGITAPRDVRVYRKELYDQIKLENQSAGTLRPADISGTVLSPPQGSPMRIVSDQPTQRDQFLAAAIEEARRGLAEGGLPIGSVLVRDGQIIGRGHNQRVQKGDAMAHAEIDCLRNAGRQATYRDTVLYSTLMPCFLCSGAAVQFGVPKVIVGESVNFPGGESANKNSHCGKSPQFMQSAGIDVIDLHDAECIEMMASFIREHPQLWNEDIGR
jgi:cytosine/creatinine deaminase